MILQHPRESDVAIGTARLVELQLARAERHVAIQLDEAPHLRERLADPNAPAILLYPGDDALDLRETPPVGPVTLLVLDGTWWQAKKLLQYNPELRSLPRYSLSPRAPSRYRIRKEPALHCISTIEAIGEALSILEGPGFDVEALLRPFDAMVDHQLYFAAKLARRRHLAARVKQPVRPRWSAVLRERQADLVVAYGEANAWPKGSALGHEPEIVHWAAERLATGERFEAFIAPRRALAPSFAHHAGVDVERVLGGETFAEFRRRWQAFCRPTDLLASWGFFGVERLRAEGAHVPELIELRELSRRQLRHKTGDVTACAAALGARSVAPWVSGRTGLRLSAAVAVTQSLLAASG